MQAGGFLLVGRSSSQKRFASLPQRPAGRRPSAAQAWLGPSRRARFRDYLGWVGSAAVVAIGFEVKIVCGGVDAGVGVISFSELSCFSSGEIS